MVADLEQRQYGGYGGGGSAPSSTSSAAAALASTGSSEHGPAAVSQASPGYRANIDAAKARSFEIAHGTLMGISFVLIFPLGGIVVRVLDTPIVGAIHGAMQGLGYVMAIAGVGLGIWLGLNVRYLDYAHTVIGLVIFSLLAVQLALGVLHHRLFLRSARKTPWTYMHVWLGRILIALGIINGGLGLGLANNSNQAKIGYGVVAGVIGLTYYIVAAFYTVRPRSAKAG